MSGTVLSEVSDGIRRITLNRPHRLNAINPELLEDLVAALQAGNGDPATAVMLLDGAGRAFCAGDDLKEFDRQAGTSAQTGAYIERIQDVTRAICLGEKLVVGAVHGWAVGGGLEWTLNCDLAVAAEGTRFFFPEIALGVFVTGAVTALLPRMVGLARARRMILLGERFDARQALDWGIVDEVAAPDRLPAAALALARRVTALPQRAARDLKRTLALTTAAGLDEAMRLETEATVRGFLDPDTARRVAAFAKG